MHAYVLRATTVGLLSGRAPLVEALLWQSPLVGLICHQLTITSQHAKTEYRAHLFAIASLMRSQCEIEESSVAIALKNNQEWTTFVQSGSLISLAASLRAEVTVPPKLRPLPKGITKMGIDW